MTEKKIKGFTLTGEEREYVFNLVDAKTGTKIFHESISVVLKLLPKEIVKSFFEDTGSEDTDKNKKTKINWFDIIEKLESHLPFERIEEYAKTFVSGAKVTIDGKVLEADEDGFGEYATGDPLAVYTAIWYAVCANYSKYIVPLLEAPE